MSYQPRGISSNRQQQASKPAAGKKAALYRTGLFAPKKEGVKTIGSVQVKEDVVIKAGSYINLYENDKRSSESSPVFNLTVTEGTLKAAK